MRCTNQDVTTPLYSLQHTSTSTLYKSLNMPQDGVALFWNPSLGVKIVTQIIGLGAVQLCSERQLAVSSALPRSSYLTCQRWKAFLEASPPSTIVRESPKPPQPRTRMERIRQTAISLCILSVAVLPLLGMVNTFWKDVAVPQVLVDGMWGLMMLWLWSTTFASVCLSGRYSCGIR